MRRCWRSRRGTPTPARRCSSRRRCGRRRGATSTPSARPAGCGSTSISPTGCRRCGRSSRSGPCHLLVESSAGAVASTPIGSSTEPLPASHVDRVDRRAGRADRARAPAADPPPRHRRGRQAERRRPGVRGALTGDAPRRQRQRQDRRARTDPRGRPRAARLPDPRSSSATCPTRSHRCTPRVHASGTSADPYKRIGPREYFERLAGIVVPRDGLVNCPAHEDRVPSCSVGTDASQGWRCHAGGCGARGAIYDLASVLLGGPWGPQLRGEAFKRARAYVIDAFGEPIGDHDGTASGRPGERSTR